MVLTDHKGTEKRAVMRTNPTDATITARYVMRYHGSADMSSMFQPQAECTQD